LTQWYGDKSYSYSGIPMAPLPWTPPLTGLKARAEALAGVMFNSALINYYRDGRDSVGWHSDAEPELGRNPVIASLSFGAMRRFQLRHNQTKELREYMLEHGSLLLMGGTVQHFWKHCLPATSRSGKDRCNLTFRYTKPL